MASGTKDHILVKVSMPYFTLFEFLQKSSLRDLTLYGIFVIRRKAFFMTLGETP